MKKQSYLAAKLAVFVAGLAMLVTAFVLLKPVFDDMHLTEQYIFEGICVFSLYLAVFAPILLGGLNGMPAAVFASGAVYYKALTTYFAITAAAGVMAFLRLPLAISIMVQLVGVFVFLIWTLAAVFTKEHIETVQIQENIKKSMVIELRSKSASPNAMAQGIEDNAIRSAVKSIEENMRYLSPSDSEMAQDMERKMVALMDAIMSDGFFAGRGDKTALESKLRDFDALYRQRKIIY